MMNGRSSRFPFTPSQWQELEHQALIFKYMASGIPVPPDLLFPLRRSSLDSPLSSTLFSHQPQHFGWNYLQMGLGRKIDPEPGRCRRTDGKKWRCSKEAYPDSKYCERHMHRGKNRSRKPVEVLKPTTTATHSNPSTQTPSSITKNNPSHIPPTTHSNFAPFHYHHHHPSSRTSGTGLSSEDNTCAPLFLDSGSYSQTNSEYRSRYVNGLREEVDEHAFFTEPSGTTSRSFSASSMEDTWQFTPLTMSSSSSFSSKRRICSGLSNEYSYLQLQSLSDNSTNQKDQTQKTVHRFFDEWPHKSRDNLDDKSSTTQLSISIPTSSHDDFPAFNSRTQRDS